MVRYLANRDWEKEAPREEEFLFPHELERRKKAEEAEKVKEAKDSEGSEESQESEKA